ncbi:MAG TPA: caspase family protein, partial [Pyrinomonadaceae bacterium]|nr:caspase family protein [Pyrinomonadaceae bacterium]
MGNFLVSITARVATLIMVSILLGASAASQQNDRQLVQNATPTVTNGRRIALVIGNGAYATAPPLKNPPNDARDIAAALKTLGFD